MKEKSQVPDISNKDLKIHEESLKQKAINDKI